MLPQMDLELVYIAPGAFRWRLLTFLWNEGDNAAQAVSDDHTNGSAVNIKRLAEFHPVPAFSISARGIMRTLQN